MINYDCIAMMLSSVISRLNLVSVCLPDEFQENIEDMKIDLTNLLKEHKYEVNLSDVSSEFFLDKESLYMELNNISRDLGTCLSLTSDEALEEASFDISCIMKTMVRRDGVHYQKGNMRRMRVLK